jgi:hypothetical protein
MRMMPQQLKNSSERRLIMAIEKTKAKVNVRNLAFWETLIDADADIEPAKYLKFGEQIVILGSAITFGGLFGDKEYFKVNHPYYGVGYVRTEGLKIQES